MATAITRLIKNLPKDSLETFFSGVHSEIADSIDWMRTNGPCENRCWRQLRLRLVYHSQSFAQTQSGSTRLLTS